MSKLISVALAAIYNVDMSIGGLYKVHVKRDRLDGSVRTWPTPHTKCDDVFPSE